MNKLNKKSGFTLIELIVVLIIVGILAAIALPNLFSNIAKSQATSALNTADSYKAAIEGCIAAPQSHGAKPGTAPCSFTSLFGSASATVSTLTGDNNFTITVAPVSYTYPQSVSYTMTGTDSAGVTAFTLTRSTTGAFSCADGSYAAYTTVC